MKKYIGKTLIHCIGKEGRFFVQTYFKNPVSINDIQSNIDANNGKIKGYSFTSVKAVRIQAREWVATAAGF